MPPEAGAYETLCALHTPSHVLPMPRPPGRALCPRGPFCQWWTRPLAEDTDDPGFKTDEPKGQHGNRAAYHGGRQCWSQRDDEFSREEWRPRGANDGRAEEYRVCHRAH